MMPRQPHLYGAEDLKKLKDSKPVPIIAHSHETIVPVVYAGMVNRFLEKKGIHLPLTHHELADMKREAAACKDDSVGYAKGTKDLKKKKKKAKAKPKAKPNRLYPRALGLAPMPPPLSRSQILYSQLRPDTFNLIRPHSTQLPQVFEQRDYKKEAEGLREALDRLRDEHRPHQEQILEQNEIEWVRRHAPLRVENVPLREPEGILPSAPPRVVKRPAVVIEEEPSAAASAYEAAPEREVILPTIPLWNRSQSEAIATIKAQGGHHEQKHYLRQFSLLDLREISGRVGGSKGGNKDILIGKIMTEVKKS